MNISKLALIALLGSALMAFGCSDDATSPGGSGGSAGAGGDGGTGGAIDPLCVTPVDMCASVAVDPIEPCCDLPAPPDQEAACDGSESVENPATCTTTGETTISVLLTQLQVNGDCDAGYNLDSCGGHSCVVGAFANGEGMNGVDNALAGLGPILEPLGNNLNGVDQALSDALCGLTDDPDLATCDGGANDGNACTMTCDGGTNDGEACAASSDCTDGTGKVCEAGDNDGDACTVDEDCADSTCVDDTGTCIITDDGCPDGAGKICDGGGDGISGEACTTDPDCECEDTDPDCEDGTCVDDTGGKCEFDDDDCSLDLPPIALRFVLDMNATDKCANLTLFDGETEVGQVPLNISDPTTGGTVCVSGTIGTIPLNIAGTAGAFSNATVQMTASENGLSDGTLGVTIDEATAAAIADTLVEGGAGIVGQVLDINGDLSGDTANGCDSVSATFTIGGASEPQ